MTYRDPSSSVDRSTPVQSVSRITSSSEATEDQQRSLTFVIRKTDWSAMVAAHQAVSKYLLMHTTMGNQTAGREIKNAGRILGLIEPREGNVCRYRLGRRPVS